MSNRQTLEDLFGIWKQWDSGGKKLPGYGKWVQIFKQIKTIRRWDVQDRLRDYHIDDLWKEELEIKGNRIKNIF